MIQGRCRNKWAGLPDSGLSSMVGGANKLLGTRLWHDAPALGALGRYGRRKKIDNIGMGEIQERIWHG